MSSTQPTNTPTNALNEAEQHEEFIPSQEDLDRESRVIASMARRWQNYRNEQNCLLGDQSPYWGMKPIWELTEEDEDEDYDEN